MATTTAATSKNPINMVEHCKGILGIETKVITRPGGLPDCRGIKRRAPNFSCSVTERLVEGLPGSTVEASVAGASTIFRGP
jgi:hypothetical protein